MSKKNQMFKIKNNAIECKNVHTYLIFLKKLIAVI